jgi:CelD/BcsL family acetyltransferase involved in cellulose biosynthesis
MRVYLFRLGTRAIDRILPEDRGLGHTLLSGNISFTFRNVTCKTPHGYRRYSPIPTHFYPLARLRHRGCGEWPSQAVNVVPSRTILLPDYQSSSVLRITEISDPTELAGCRLLWKSLLARTPGATFFHSLDWLEPQIRHFGHWQELRVLVVRCGNEPMGIVPLVMRRERTKLGSVRVLTYPLDHAGVSYGPIGAQPAATLTAALQYIRSQPRDWDLLSLRFVDRDGADRGRTGRALRFVGWQPTEEADELAPCVNLRGSWHDYWASRDGDWRNNVSRSERRLAEQGEIVHLRYRPSGVAYGDSDPRWDLFDTCLDMGRQSRQSSVKSGTALPHPFVEPYLRDAHEAAVRSGGLDLNLLLVDGQPAAFAYNYQYSGRVYCLRMGYNPAVSCDGAGSVLMCRMLEDCFARGDHTFNLGPSSFAHTQPWQTSVETSYRYTYFSGGTRAQALRIKSRLKQWLMRHRAAADSS